MAVGAAKAAARIGEESLSLNKELSGAVSFEDFANRVVKACAKAADAQICTFWRVYADGEQQRLRLAAAYGVEAPRTLATEITYAINSNGDQSKYDGLTGYVASERVPVLVDSFQQLQSNYAFCWRGKMDTTQWKSEPQTHMKNLYAVPLMLGDELQGVLKLENHNRGPFTKEDTATIDSLAERIALAAKALVLLDSHDRHLIDAPARLSEALVRPFETAQLAQHIVDVTADILNAQVCSLWLVDDTGTMLQHQANSGFRGQAGQVPTYRIDVDPKEADFEIKGITAWVAIRRRPFGANSHEELREHPSWKGAWDPVMYGDKAIAKREFRSMYAVPLAWNTELLGVLKVENPQNAQHFSPNDRIMCEIMANYVVLLLVLTRQLRLQLLPSMAHTLNAPSAGVAMVLKQLDRELAKTTPKFERMKEYVNLAKRGTLTIAGMSRTLSAEITARVAAQPMEQVDLADFLEKQVSKIRNVAPDNVQLVLDNHADGYFLPMSRSEKIWLEIIVFNLLHNGVRYSPRGGTVTLECRPVETEIRIVVTDQGTGVSEKDKPHIFERHFIGKRPKGWPEGTGLGLYEVRRLVNHLGWSVSVGDNVPHGARFVITIPVHWRIADGKSQKSSRGR